MAPLDRAWVILCRPSSPENIGSTARAMMNTGASRLALVAPATEDWETARRVALTAAPILDGASRFATLRESLEAADPSLVVGTTARGRRYWQAAELPEAAAAILRGAGDGPLALVFGPEDRGLTNEELALCSMVVSLPSAPALASYNLSHAAAIVLFSLLTARPQGDPPAPPREAASFASMEGMYGHLEELLQEAGFLWESNPGHMMKRVRDVLNRARLTEAEATAVRGACRRIMNRLGRE